MESTTWKNFEYHFWNEPLIPTSTVRYMPASLSLTLRESYEEGKRWYVAGEDRYPSITTLLSATDDEGQKSLHAWRRRVGTVEAERVSRTAAARGTQWHDFCDAFLTGKSVWRHLAQPQDTGMAAAIAKILNERIATVLLSESRIYSTQYQVAGRMDICAELTDGRLAVIDFKTGKKPKAGNRLANYALQATFYADALTEWLNRGPVETIVIVQLCPTVVVWQESSASLWREELQSRVALFKHRQSSQNT